MAVKWVASLLIIIGIAVLSYPSLHNQYVAHQQTKLFERFEQQPLLTEPQTDINDSYEQLDTVFDQGDRRPLAFPSIDDAVVLATLEIPSIQLKLPVLEGATMTNLEYAVGHMSETADFGEPGNVALAAHRSYKAGKLFNRLDEVKPDDTITAVTQAGELQYRVTKAFRVSPNDLSVLNQPDDYAMMTLITCDPIEDPTHRLIVQAEQVNE
ncbi:class D sortase [Thalassobacillus sp. CUG 92003]|uniref:class D sortase n=1 Tax=Thalassobacillus sp. CUG 92003 TaxID=2736641 RepID=UPI0015E780F2|nr:class D sortase [Thalassobacillus sp. CUG 92003]